MLLGGGIGVAEEKGIEVMLWGLRNGLKIGELGNLSFPWRWRERFGERF